MRTIHPAFSSILCLSLIAGCSGGAPGDEETLYEPTGNSTENLFLVGGSCSAGSTLTNPNNKPVMHGTVNVYFIGYGNFNPAVTSALRNYVPILSESSYLAMNSVYTDGSGPTTSTLAFGGFATDAIIVNANHLSGAPYSQGKSLTEAKIKTEVDRAIAGGVFPRDANGIYVVISDSQTSVGLSGLTSCSGFCGFHGHGLNSSTDIKYAYVVDPESSTTCGGCQWPAPTPHDVETDSTISIFTHELIETLTDPGLNAWFVRDTTALNGSESADLCGNRSGPTYAGGHPDFFGNLVGGPANLHLGSDDYLVQMQWVNPDNSGAQSYGLPFWGQNFGWNGFPVGDWARGSYKAQCSPGQPVIGVSSDVSETNVHSVLCQSNSSWPNYMQGSACYGLSFDPGNNMIANPEGDWDRGYYKAECNTNEFVAGVSQSTSGKLNGIMCCPGGASAALRHRSCNVETFYGTNSFDYRGPDWDSGYYKGECGNGRYLAGVSSTADGFGSAHGLLCCLP
jgi:hypothetical protein